MSELIQRCSRNVANPTKEVMWLMAVEVEENKYQDSIVSGRLYDLAFSSMENKILVGLEKIISGEFKRQVDHLRDRGLR